MDKRRTAEGEKLEVYAQQWATAGSFYA